VVTGAVRDSEAVLEIARMLEADLVVVGTRAPSTLFTGRFRTEVAARVVAQSARSVLVLPLDESSPAAG
jgi:nucleotide-binding universal stress UspA family protein